MQLLVYTLIFVALADAPSSADPPEPSEPSTPNGSEDDPGVGIDEPGSSEPLPAEGTPPEDAEDTPLVVQSESDPFGEVLESAKRIYFEGGHGQALEMLLALQQRILGGEEVPEDTIAETMLYLGEIQLKLGDETKAWETYEWLLRRDPEQTISPFLHPADAVMWFGQVKKYVLQSIADVSPPDPLPPPPPLPAWGYAPFGIPQFYQGRIGAGVAFGTLQLGLAATSIAVYVDLARINKAGTEDDPSPQAFARRVNLERYLVQWPATLGFYGLWVGSSLHGRHTWRREHEIAVSVTLAPDPSRPGLFVSARF